MVEQEAVNFEVAGSSPVPGAILDESPFFIFEMSSRIEFDLKFYSFL